MPLVPHGDSWRNAIEFLSRLDFGDDVESCWEFGQICGAHSVAVAGGAREGRQIAIGRDLFGEYSAAASRRSTDSVWAADRGGMLFDHIGALFEGQNQGRCGGNGDMRKMIEDAS